ncbi:hypothetical protein AAIB33_13485 [Microbacterium sp. AZCO]|uniref:alpha-L-rhamnosidase-related protein n=1 Tax=Microbacterium sp. AZCO TaxID=3142976 RepID=UPI0031F37055
MTRIPRTAQQIRHWVAERSPQPFAESEVRAPDASHIWLYGPDQYQLALLARLVAEGFAANRHVHYSDNHARTSTLVVFRTVVEGGGMLRLRASGSVSARVDGEAVPVEIDPSGEFTLRLAAACIVELRVTGDEIITPAIRLSPDDHARSEWSVHLGNGDWVPAEPRIGGIHPPHLSPPGTVTLRPRGRDDDLLDVGAPVLGRPIFTAGPRPFVASGESTREAWSDPEAHETRHDLVELPDGRWTTRHRLGFRYLRTDRPAAEVEVEASVAPAPRAGAFACSDDRLTRIWAAAQYTLRTCAQGLLVDGIKRDRMPWAGDQALSTLANAFALGAGDVVADGLVALGRPLHGYVNGISDYSLWWLINTDLYLLCFGDPEFAQRRAAHVHAFVADLAEHAGRDAVFRPATQPGGFVDAGPGSVFIDWGVRVEPGRDSVALQMLWYGALRSAQRVLSRAGHDGAVRWGELADRLCDTLESRAWSDEQGRWTEYLDDGRGQGDATYANFLALLVGIHPRRPPGVVEAARRGSTGTPFMTALRLRSLVADGVAGEVLAEIDRVWGDMLDRGPGTFWEEASSDGDRLEMYGRPFGRSLCHAWSAGPAAVIPEAVLGARPVGDGWSTFAVEPRLGDLEWAALVVPAPAGDIVVVADRERTVIEVPGGATLVSRGTRWSGPATVVLPAVFG